MSGNQMGFLGGKNQRVSLVDEMSGKSKQAQSTRKTAKSLLGLKVIIILRASAPSKYQIWKGRR